MLASPEATLICVPQSHAHSTASTLVAEKQATSCCRNADSVARLHGAHPAARAGTHAAAVGMQQRGEQPCFRAEGVRQADPAGGSRWKLLLFPAVVDDVVHTASSLDLVLRGYPKHPCGYKLMVLWCVIECSWCKYCCCLVAGLCSHRVPKIAGRGISIKRELASFRSKCDPSWRGGKHNQSTLNAFAGLPSS